MKTVDVPEFSQAQELKFGGFEMFLPNPNNFEEVKSADKYKDKLKTKMVETFLFENGQPVCWLFTDKNGYIMRRSHKKMSIEYIITYLIHQLRKYDMKNNKEPFLNKITDEKIIGDLNKFSSLIDQKNYSKEMLFSEPAIQYLLKVDRIKFLLIIYFERNSKYEFMNILEFFKLLNDSNKINNVSMVQNFIEAQCLHQNPNQVEFMLTKERLRLLTAKYWKPKELGPKKVTLYFNKPKILSSIDCEMKMSKTKNNKLVRTNTISDSAPKDINTQIEEIENELIMVNNDNLTVVMTNMIEPILKYFEKKKMISITLGYFTFVKIIVNGAEMYAFHLTEFLHGISKHQPELIRTKTKMKDAMNNIISKRVPSDIKKVKKYEKITGEAFCFGEFCTYKIPKTFKGLKKNQKIDENTLTQKIPKENKFTNRDKNHNLPYFLPIFEVKRAYDNPQLVNIVLKAYSIFPKNFDKEEEIAKILKERKELEEKKKQREKQKEENAKKIGGERKRKGIANELGLDVSIDDDEEEEIDALMKDQTVKKKHIVSLYTPTPNKFAHINYDEMYTEKNICENCFKIYTLVNDFLSNIDENTAQFKNINKAKDLLLRGENLKTNVYEENNEINFEDNLLFQEEIQDLSLKKLLKRGVFKRKIEEMEKQKHKDDKIHLHRQGRTRKDDMEKIFSYRININPRLLKLNLVAEKSKNKFFKLIFNEIKAEPETIYQKLGIQKPLNEKPVSMPLLRMHMGINSHIYNPDINMFKKLNELGNEDDSFLRNYRKKMEIEEVQMNIQRENYQIDNDLFLFYKNLMKSEGMDGFNLDSEDSEAMSEAKGLEDKSFGSNDELVQEVSSSHSENLGERRDEPGKIPESYKKSVLNTEESGESRVRKSSFGFGYKKRKTLGSDSVKVDGTKVDPRKNYRRINSVKVPKHSLDQKSFENDYLNVYKCKSKKSQKLYPNSYSKCFTLRSNKRDSASQLRGEQFFDEDFLRRSKQREEEQRKKKLEEFLRISPELKPIASGDEGDNLVSSPKNEKKKKNEKKITLTSVFYDKSVELYKDKNTPYYFITTPFPLFNEGNLPISENPLIYTQNITTEQFIKIGRFDDSALFSNAKIFVYNSSTAIPYEIVTVAKKVKPNPKTFKRQQSILVDKKSSKLLLIVLNDFFDSYIKYKRIIEEVTKTSGRGLIETKCIFFNFPGQSSTMWSKDAIFNNSYYAEFFDRFLYYLFNEKVFDQTYNLVLVGFGNGGQVALTYTSFYEKYWDFLHTVIMFNGYCENDAFLNQSMVEILKIVKKTKNPKTVEFFIKSVTIDPQKLVNSQLGLDVPKEIKEVSLESSMTSKEINETDEDNPNPITLQGYHSITKGYFYNTKINHRDIHTKIIATHSNSDSFISINNLKSLFFNKIKAYTPTELKGRCESANSTKGSSFKKAGNTKKTLPSLVINSTEANTSGNNIGTRQSNMTKANTVSGTKGDQKEKEEGNGYDFSELKDGKTKRKLIVIEGSHDISDYEGSVNVTNVLGSYFSFLIDNNLLTNAS